MRIKLILILLLSVVICGLVAFLASCEEGDSADTGATDIVLPGTGERPSEPVSGNDDDDEVLDDGEVPDNGDDPEPPEDDNPSDDEPSEDIPPEDGSSEDKHEHTLVYVPETAAACENGGNIAYWQCTDCRKLFSDNSALEELTAQEVLTEAAGHEYVSSTVSADCTRPGYTLFTCAVCGNSYIDESSYTPSYGHDMGDWTVVTEATCEREGELIRRCLVCDYMESIVIPAGDHNFTPAVSEATCEEDGYIQYTCADCGYSYIDGQIVPAFGHNYGDWETTTEPSCDAEGEQSRSCERCGKIEYEKISPLGHSYIATIKPPSCTEGGFTLYKCENCKDSYISDYTAQSEHEYAATIVPATCTSEGYTLLVCAGCGHQQVEDGSYTPKAGHSFGDWQTATPAGCTSGGLKVRECSVCGANEQQEVPASGHSYECVVQAPSCTEGGYNEYICSVCKDSYKTDFTEQLGHDYVQTIVPATCQTEGYALNVCTRCKDEYIVENSLIPPSGHSYGEWETTLEPSCTDSGLQTARCDTCGDEQYRELAPLGHSYGGWYVVAEVSCTQDGLRERVCSHCGGYERETVVSTGHSYTETVVAPDCENGGYTLHECSACGDAYSDNPVESLGHDFGEWKVLTPSACEKGGVEISYCGRCNEYTTREISPAGHRYESYVHEPTCTEGGYTEHRCQDCGVCFTDGETSSLGHNYEVSGTVEPTESESGYTEYTCTRCGDSYRVELEPVEPTPTEGIKYELNDDGYYSVTGIEAGICVNELIIPAEYEGIAVTEISDGAFAGNTDITEARLGQNIVRIGSRAFESCVVLKSVNIPASVKEIGEEAFRACSSLENIDYEAVSAEDCVVGIFAGAGSGGEGIKVTFGADVERIPSGLFYCLIASQSPKITAVEFEEGEVLREIGDSAFANCADLTSVSLPATVEEIGTEAFYCCTSLAYVAVPSAAHVGSGAFEGTAINFEIDYFML